MPRKRTVKPKTIPLATRHNAMQDYVAGNSVDTIAVKYEINPKTVKKWITRYKWDEEKKKAEQEAKDTLYEKYRVKVMQITEYVMDGARIASAMAAAAIQEIYKEETKKGKSNTEFRKVIAETKRAVSVLNDCAKLMHTTMPAAPHDMAEEILEELRKLNAKQEKGEMKIAV